MSKLAKFDRKLTKKSKRRRQHEAISLIEPPRKSLYDVICESMKTVGRVTYVHRIIYIGDNNVPDNGLVSAFRENIETVNSSYYDERLTGFLLHYPKFFCHVVEGSEQSISKHLSLLYASEVVKKLGRLKLLTAYHHANQRFLSGWMNVSAKAPHLLEKIDGDAELPEAMGRAMYCVRKLYKLGAWMRAQSAAQETPVVAPVHVVSRHAYHETALASAPSRHAYMEPEQKPTTSTLRLVKASPTMADVATSNADLAGKLVDCLPENQLLEFLLDNRHVYDLADYVFYFGRIPVLLTYIEKSWPVQIEAVPKHMFDKDIDPITDLPTRQENVTSI